jgi:hypothetical protein
LLVFVTLLLATRKFGQNTSSASPFILEAKVI